MANKYLKETVLQVVDNQLRANDPPVTNATYKRLQTLGYTKQQAREAIASVLLEEVYDVLKSKEPYNEERYTARLNELS